MSDVSRRDFLKAAVLAPLLPSLLGACRRADDRRVVNFYNWSNYIGKDTLSDFKKKTGVEVRYDMFADEEEMFAKTHTSFSPWIIVMANNKRKARLESMRYVLSMLDYKEKPNAKISLTPDPNTTCLGLEYFCNRVE